MLGNAAGDEVGHEGVGGTMKFGPRDRSAVVDDRDLVGDPRRSRRRRNPRCSTMPAPGPHGGGYAIWPRDSPYGRALRFGDAHPRGPGDDQSFTKAETGAEARSRSCPSPTGATAQFTVISVDDHIVEPPDTFEGRLPEKFADRAPKVVETRRRRVLGVRRHRSSRTSGSTRSSGVRSTSTASSRPASTTCAAARGTSTRASPTWTSTAIYASLNFPSFLPGFAGQRLQTSTKDPELALGDGPGVERLAPRGVGRRLSRTGSSRARSRTSSTPRSAPRRSGRTPARGFKAVTFTGVADAARAAVAAHAALGPDHARRARRPRRSSTSTSDRRARRRRHADDAPPDVVGVLFFGVRDVRRRRLAVLEDPRALPRPEDLPVGRRDRLGAGPASTGSTTCSATTRCTAPGAGIDLTPVRGAAAQLLVLRGRGPVVVRAARPHRRRAHPRRARLPALRLDVAAHAARHRATRSATCRPTTIRKITWRNASASTGTPCPKRSNATRNAF